MNHMLTAHIVKWFKCDSSMTSLAAYMASYRT